MRPERAAITVGVHLPEVEIVGALHVPTKLRVIFVGRQNQRCATTPAPHQLGGHPFLLFRRIALLAEKIAKCANMLFDPEISNIAAVPGENLRLRQSRRRSIFIRIAQKKLAGFNCRTGAGSWLLAYSFDHRLRESVSISKVFVSV